MAGECTMLRKLSINNFKCFSNETVFDFRKTNYKFLEKNTFGKVLKGALFVGEHASGKTTILQSVKLLLELLFRESTCDLASYQCLFSKEKVSRLLYEFDIDGHELVYSFAFSGNSFVEENLMVDNQTVIGRLGKKSKWIDGKKTILCDVEDSALFLRQVSVKSEFSDHDILGRWLVYLKNSVYIDTYSRRISAFDGEGLSAEKYVEKHGTEKINDFLTEYQLHFLIQYGQTDTKTEGDSESEGEKRLFFRQEGRDALIPLCMESSGIRTLINMLPAFFWIANRGGMLMIDQFGVGLHNRVEELLVRYMMEKETAAQLFLTSHSTNLLSNSLLRPDQIFAVERAGEQEIGPHRFSDEQPRVAQNLEKMYLSGVFGGLPSYKI
jgi:predicted ATP-dependent endonuclease of OLD family